MARVLRRRLAELEGFAFEKACVKMLHAFHFRDLKVAKRNPNGPLLTARRREGSVEFRYAIRMVRGNGSLDRKAVQDLRRDMGHCAAQIGLLLTPGDVRVDARGESQSQGALAMIWGGDALADKFLEAKSGVTVQLVELFEVDERFFEAAKQEGDEAAHRREVRARERELESPARAECTQARSESAAEAGGGSPDGSEAAPAGTAETPEVTEPSAARLPAAAVDDDEGNDGEEGDEAEGAEASAAGGAAGTSDEVGPNGEPRRKRRRRRRGRRGRGQRPEGTPGTPGEAGPAGGAEATPSAAAAAEPAAPAPSAPPPTPENAG
ncbi:MAG: restriction endonuclease [Deltaproteobacteria bacterium]|nr:restriction endonuclease [Deltaproteobacteria bacterium]